ncbi:hypothetical protein LCGC14_1086070 [marine sediment metagenome]|uniref:Uncharacterized protein n=1 Tax=marine sediment metagenome TaxID=412755 RepID=A0A0F9N1D3_9ZZZZ
MPITHPFVSGKADGGDATEVRASNWNADHAGFAQVRKTATQGVTNSTALVDCTQLLIALLANEVWMFDACIFFEADTTPDIKFAFKVPAGATLLWGISETVDAATSNHPVYRARSVSDDAQSIHAPGLGTAVPAHLMGTVVNGATPGDLQLRFAQDVADAGNPANVLAQSWLRGFRE